MADGPLKVHHLRPAPGSHTKKTRVGRGNATKGKTAGRGTKGTKARYQVPARFEGGQMPIHMRLPKLKGFTNRNPGGVPGRQRGPAGRAVPRGRDCRPGRTGRRPAPCCKGEPVKVLGNGDLGGVRLEITAHAFSASAREKIVAAGGTASEL